MIAMKVFSTIEPVRILNRNINNPIVIYNTIATTTLNKDFKALPTIA